MRTPCVPLTDLAAPCLPGRRRYLTGFVPQDDVVHETMTVRENLFYSAALRLPRGTPRAARETAVRGALSMLGMAHVQHDIVGNVGRKGLSGGQRKVRAAGGMGLDMAGIASLSQRWQTATVAVGARRWQAAFLQPKS